MLTTETQAYDLPGGHGFVRLLDVEYPAQQQPASYLTQVDPWDPDFTAGNDVYALRPIDDDMDADADEIMGRIVFAQTVATGEQAILTYKAMHRAASNDDDIITVPEAHLEAIIAFVDRSLPAG